MKQATAPSLVMREISGEAAHLLLALVSLLANLTWVLLTEDTSWALVIWSATYGLGFALMVLCLIVAPMVRWILRRETGSTNVPVARTVTDLDGSEAWPILPRRWRKPSGMTDGTK